MLFTFILCCTKNSKWWKLVQTSTIQLSFVLDNIDVTHSRYTKPPPSSHHHQSHHHMQCIYDEQQTNSLGYTPEPINMCAAWCACRKRIPKNARILALRQNRRNCLHDHAIRYVWRVCLFSAYCMTCATPFFRLLFTFVCSSNMIIMSWTMNNETLCYVRLFRSPESFNAFCVCVHIL